MSNFEKRRCRCACADANDVRRICRLAMITSVTGFCVSVGFVVLTLLAGS